MKRAIRYFLEGLLYVIPLAVTVFILYKIFVTVDSWLNLPIPGVGFLLTIVGIFVIGFLASNVLTQGLMSLISQLFEKVPFIKLIYTSIKDLIGAFVGEKKSFDKPVLVTLSQEGFPKAIGFITKEDLEAFGLTDHVAVYLPQSYNFAGNLLIFPVEQVQILDVDSSEVMAFLVSGGVSGK
ncbi:MULTISPECIES: DUF502 domain-containing protein [Brevibacillus]|uniref:DUF502 domain-containing protein n=1 Tax=Brevibacillus invocatus TaxID=173959 RepID=A0A3M8CIM2_9BACL|nr:MULTISPECIES: DUF502 domain-containing protein [Brevibacillus]MCM3080312.1 DUF502 domain-containing protein [Brevibacillus invocatus]MCM3430435.1 DUF502 domain-containing protein [Brevibacillus invocatus]MDH4615789.1 DUF502 domain-containing protein [Brevibacillus sp. AY1]RNB75564.1 DUF502 domain-containing protein [Brevibacillus invocatus]